LVNDQINEQGQEMKKRSRLSIAAWLLVAAVMSGGLLPARAESVLRVAKTSIPRILDPIFTTSFTERDFGYLIYDTLFAVDKGFQVKPQMVDSWTVSPDRLTYTFRLRDGLLFHDGTSVTAADCIASIKRWAERDVMGQTLASFTKEWIADDGKTFRLILQQPYALVLSSLGKVGSSVPFIMPERIARTSSSEPIKEFVGSGPFIFDQKAGTGVKLVFRKNAHYVPRSEPSDWATGAKLPKVDVLEWIEFRDGMTAVNALTNGEIDLIQELPHDLAPLLEGDPNVKVMVYNELGQLGFVRFNFLQPPFNDVRYRRAVEHAMRQEDFLRAVVGDPKYYKVCRSIYSCGSPYETEAGVPKIDFALSRDLLKEAGYEGKPIVQFMATNSATIGPISEVATRLLREAGFKVDPQAMDFQTFTRRRLNQGPPEQGGWNIAFSTWTGADVVDPVVNPTLSGAGEKAPWGWPTSPEIEALRRNFAQEPDMDKRKEIAAEIQRVNYDEAIYIPTGTFVSLAAYRSNVKGVFSAPAMMMWNISKD
jgi:peptide/nickel transport system substrate-binding protein